MFDYNEEIRNKLSQDPDLNFFVCLFHIVNYMGFGVSCQL